MDRQLLAQQVRLKALGLYTGAIDGLWGPATERAIDALIAIVEKSRGIKPVLWPRLDPAHAFLRDIVGLPAVTRVFLDILGTIEVKGTGSSPLILSWGDELNIPRTQYPNDGVPWCGLAAAIAAKRAGKDVPVNPLWARNWTNFGVPVDPKHPMLGDYMVWSREGGGGHVNNYVAESVVDGVRFFHGIGGNQNDQVNIMRRRADVGLLGVRRPVYRVQPASVKAYTAGTGAALADREA